MFLFEPHLLHAGFVFPGARPLRCPCNHISALRSASELKGTCNGCLQGPGTLSSPSGCAKKLLIREQDPAEFDQATALPNGLRVATEALPGPFSAVGVYVDAGSRYEDEELRGVSHIIDRLAFKVSIWLQQAPAVRAEKWPLVNIDKNSR